MGKTTSKKQVALDWVKDHPRQSEFFAETSDVELQELADDLERRGQQEPIHCCPDGTIIRGHRRVKAARLLGWSQIIAIIRQEAADPLAPDVVEELLLDNLMRRQLDDLAVARIYRHLKESSELKDFDGSGDTRDRLAARLNCGKSGRSLDRLERLLDLPREIQDAISRGELTKLDGERILKLSIRKQTRIATAIQKEEEVEPLLTQWGIRKRQREKTRQQVGKELLSVLRQTIPLLDGKLNALDRVQVGNGNGLDVLDEAVEFLSRWRDRKRSLHERSLGAMMMRLEKSSDD